MEQAGGVLAGERRLAALMVSEAFGEEPGGNRAIHIFTFRCWFDVHALTGVFALCAVEVLSSRGESCTTVV